MAIGVQVQKQAFSYIPDLQRGASLNPGKAPHRRSGSEKSGKESVTTISRNLSAAGFANRFPPVPATAAR
jgi:hypothetical protein